MFEEAEHGGFLDEGFYDPDAAIGFLGVCGEVAEECLDVFAFFVDDRIYIIDGNSQDREGCQYVEA
jgi:hypothetical protein